MNHLATPDSWYCYRRLPEQLRELADKNFALLRQDPQHPSLRLKKVGAFWSARVGLHYRALARDRAEGLVWFWIGHHSVYDQFLQRSTGPPNPRQTGPRKQGDRFLVFRRCGPRPRGSGWASLRLISPA
jgi:hypothetical protein